ncbi:hypothetical protein N7475_009651 [Penicillium sp. IBT 31633x]|nr:hypothetical protein N7475_009651 [Penicillium sp. IBT 31633x]
MGAGGVSGNHQPYGGDALVGVSAAIAVVQISFVAARLYTRFMQQIKLGIDDYLILLASTANLGESVIYIVLAKIGGAGYHFDYVSQMPDAMVVMRKCIVALQVLDYPFNITPAKLALLMFYLRVFPTRKFRIFVYLVGALVLAVGVCAFLATVLQCRPFPYTWDRSIPGGTCMRRIEVFRILIPLNVLSGILILLMPIPAVWKLHAPRGQKLAVTGVFLLGGLGTLASIFRMAVYFAAEERILDDPTWFSVKLGILTVLEGGLLIIAACLISIWPLFTRFQAMLARHKSRKIQHQCWHQEEMPTNNQGQEENSGHGEMHLLREEACTPPFLPCSLADLEDQRLAILIDERIPSSHYEPAVLSQK